MLQHLIQQGMLNSSGTGRGAVYFLPGQDMPTPDDVFGPAFIPTTSSSVLKDSSSASDQEHDKHGYINSDQLPLPVINNLAALSPELLQRLEKLASVPREKKKMSREAFEEVVLSVCEGHYLTLQALSELLNRQPASLCNGYLSPMVRDKKLTLAFPTTPTHERQAYCATPTLANVGESKTE